MAYTYGTITHAKGRNGSTISQYDVRLGYELQSQDEETNTSIIKLQLEVRSTNSSYKTFGYNQTTTIDGTSLSADTFDMRNTNVWQIFGTRTITVNHDDDGEYSAEKTGSFTTTATGDYSLKSGSASVTVTLPTIQLQTIRIRVNGEWKKAFPYVRVNGEWKKAKAYIRVNNEWKKGK